MLANLNYAPIGAGRYWAIIHLLGDPVDSVWSLLSRVEVWNRCYSLAELHNYERGSQAEPRFFEDRIRNLAIILAALEELLGPMDISSNPMESFIQEFSSDALTHSNFDNLCWTTAGQLADVRVREMRRTWLSVLLYLFTVVSAFVPKTGGTPSSPPGGRIAFAMLLSCLISMVHLSNVVGDFTNRRDALRIMLTLKHELNQRPVADRISAPANLPEVAHAEPQQAHAPRAHSLEIEGSMNNLEDKLYNNEYWASLAWMGAIYSYRPKKNLFRGSPKHDNSAMMLAFVSTVPVFFASLTGFGILWHTTPQGLTCRHFVIFAAMTSWLISPVLTFFISHFPCRRRDSEALARQAKVKWYITLAKDAFFAIPILVLVIGSSSGMFNSCRYWSGIYMLGFEGAYVPLNTDRIFEINMKGIYPVLVSLCLGVQLFLFCWMHWIGRKGLRVMKWSEAERLAAMRATLPGPFDNRRESVITNPNRSVVDFLALLRRGRLQSTTDHGNYEAGDLEPPDQQSTLR